MFTYIPEQVCAKEMVLKIDNDIIENVEITGGCPGSAVGMARHAAGAADGEGARRALAARLRDPDTAAQASGAVGFGAASARQPR